MIRFLHQQRVLIASILAVITGRGLWMHFGFPTVAENPLLAVVSYRSPYVYWAMKLIWNGSLATLPFLYVYLPLLANLRRAWPARAQATLGALPPSTDPSARGELAVVLGELHHAHRIEPSPNPQWLTIPEDGLGLGILALGAPGSGKSAGVMLPVAHQLFANPMRIGGLVLEVKGDFCGQVRDILLDCGRGQDYLELGFESDYVYNPLHNDASPDAVAFQITSLKKALTGASKDPFWDDSMENLVTFLILAYRILYGYVTLFDVYCAAGNIKIIDALMAEAEIAFAAPVTYLLLDVETYLEAKAEIDGALKAHEWTKAEPGRVKTPHTPDLDAQLTLYNVPFDIATEGPQRTPEELERYQTAKRYYAKLKHLEATSPELLRNVAEGVNVFLSVTDINPTVRRIFCPPKEAYNPALNEGFQYGRPLPPLDELVESSRVVALKLPIAADEKLARIIGVLLKQDWQRAVLNRIPRMQRQPGVYRSVAMLIDEYHLLATAGGSKPIGDEKFLNLCRGAKCIPVVAFQSLSSLRDAIPQETWRTILAAFATTVCLRQKDLFTAEIISKMCGRVPVLKEHHSLSESDQDATVSVVTGRTTAPKSSVSVSHSYNESMDYLIETRLIMELPRGIAVVLANDGDRQLPPTLVYLCPHGKNAGMGYWGAGNRLARFFKGAA